MTPAELLENVRRMRIVAPVAERLEQLVPSRKKWWRHQKEHWERWLGEYDGPGFYSRKPGERDAAYAYGHIQCAPMLLWLAESGGVELATIERAAAAVLQAKRSGSAQCGALRRVIPWETIEKVLKIPSKAG